MKTIGLIGGTSWESTVEYYRIINEGVRQRLGEHYSAMIFMYSFNFAPIASHSAKNEWNEIERMMVWAGHKLEKAGADFIVLCANTLHKIVPAMEQEIGIPILHIADAMAQKIRERGMKKLGLIGTRFTMEEDFYRSRLKEYFDIDTLIPEKDDRDMIHHIIYHELATGSAGEASRKKFLKVIGKLSEQGAEGVILGCTEIPLIVCQEDTPVPLFNTTAIHAEAAVNMAIDI